jgi:hypothetical protein
MATGLNTTSQYASTSNQNILVTVDPTGISTHSTDSTFTAQVPVNRPASEVLLQLLHEIDINASNIVTSSTNAPLYKLVADLDKDGTVDNDVTDLSKSLADLGLAYMGSSGLRTTLSGGVNPTLKLADV